MLIDVISWKCVHDVVLATPFICATICSRNDGTMRDTGREVKENSSSYGMALIAFL